VLDLGLEQPLLDPLNRLELLLVVAVDRGQLDGDRVALPLTVVNEPEALLEAVELVQEAAHSAAPGQHARAHEAKADEKGCPGGGTPLKDLARTFSSVSNLSPQIPDTTDSPGPSPVPRRAPRPTSGGSTRIRTEV